MRSSQSSESVPHKPMRRIGRSVREKGRGRGRGGRGRGRGRGRGGLRRIPKTTQNPESKYTKFPQSIHNPNNHKLFLNHYPNNR
eukprot:UN02903